MTVFYADDDPEEIDFFCHALKKIDDSIQCITASDGASAISVLEKMEQPAFIFLDFNMPKKNGRECLYEIKRNKRLGDVPVFIYSNMVNEKEIKELIKLGARFLSKSFNSSQLHHQLGNILRPVSNATD
jgi:CheY-like chemotaxis protein